jgi:hypothetical protein
MALALLALLAAGSRGGGVSLDPVLSTVSGARYRRGTGDLAQTVNGPWLRQELCFAQPSTTCLQPMPAALIETVCRSKACWRVDKKLLTHVDSAAKPKALGEATVAHHPTNSRHVLGEKAWLTLTIGTDIVPFCCEGKEFDGCVPTPKDCLGSTTTTLSDWAAECGCALTAVNGNKLSLRQALLIPGVLKLAKVEYGGVDHVATWSPVVKAHLQPSQIGGVPAGVLNAAWSKHSARGAAVSVAATAAGDTTLVSAISAVHDSTLVRFQEPPRGVGGAPL